MTINRRDAELQKENVGDSVFVRHEIFELSLSLPLDQVENDRRIMGKWRNRKHNEIPASDRCAVCCCVFNDAPHYSTDQRGTFMRLILLPHTYTRNASCTLAECLLTLGGMEKALSPRYEDDSFRVRSHPFVLAFLSPTSSIH